MYLSKKLVLETQIIHPVQSYFDILYHITKAGLYELLIRNYSCHFFFLSI